MPSLRERDRAIRSALAVLAVLAGLVLLVGPRCANGMGPMMPMVGGSTMSMSHQATRGQDTAGQDTVVAEDGVPTARIAEGPRADTRQGEHWGGLLAACLAFVAAALVALVRRSTPTTRGPSRNGAVVRAWREQGRAVRGVSPAGGSTR